MITHVSMSPRLPRLMPRRSISFGSVAITMMAHLTSNAHDGIFAIMAAATLIQQYKVVAANGDITELVVWLVPNPVWPSHHSYKYRAAYVVNGKRMVGFDNERGKGDHMHIGDKELPYIFTTPDQLGEDFIAAIDEYRRK